MPPVRPGSLIARHRGRIAGLTRAIRNGERPTEDPELGNAQRDLAAAKIAAYIERTVAAAPPLTREQIAQLRVLLEPARRELARQVRGTDAELKRIGKP